MALGEILRRAREARRISVNQAALETRIRQTVLESLEAEDYTSLPPRPFLRGLLRNYALYLNLDPDTVLEEYDIDTGARPARPVAPPREPEPPPPVAPPVVEPLPNRYAPPPEQDPEPFAFPPFQIAATAKAVDAAEAEELPANNTIYEVAPEVVEEVPEPTALLNIPQEPPTFAQRVGSTRIPEAVALICLAIALFALVSVGFSAFQNFTFPFGSEQTPEPTTPATATIPPGSTPTRIPALLQTLPPPTPIAGLTGPTATAVVSGTLVSETPDTTVTATATPDIPADAEMTLILEANEELGAWVIVDDDEVFNGNLTSETRTFTARERMYVQIKNIERGRVFFQGTRILPRNQQERFELNRAWFMNPQGTPVMVPPTPYPSIVVPTDFPTRTPSPTTIPSPTPTRTATSTLTPSATRTATPVPSATATLTRTPTLTATSTRTATRTATTTRTATQTATLTRTATRTATRTPTLTPSRTQTATATLTRTRTRTATASPSITRTRTPTRTATGTRTVTGTRTRTGTPTTTRTRTLTRTLTPSRTLTATPTP